MQNSTAVEILYPRKQPCEGSLAQGYARLMRATMHACYLASYIFVCDVATQLARLYNCKCIVIQLCSPGLLIQQTSQYDHITARYDMKNHITCIIYNPVHRFLRYQIFTITLSVRCRDASILLAKFIQLYIARLNLEQNTETWSKILTIIGQKKGLPERKKVKIKAKQTDTSYICMLDQSWLTRLGWKGMTLCLNKLIMVV